MNGPKFLLTDIKNKQNHEKEQTERDSLNEILAEEKKIVLLNLSLNNSNENIGQLIDINRFSCLQKLNKVTGWVLRFINKSRKKKKQWTQKYHLLIEENGKAELPWIKENQSKINIKQWKDSLEIKANENNLLRVNGKIKTLIYRTKPSHLSYSIVIIDLRY